MSRLLLLLLVAVVAVSGRNDWSWGSEPSDTPAAASPSGRSLSAPSGGNDHPGSSSNLKKVVVFPVASSQDSPAIVPPPGPRLAGPPSPVPIAPPAPLSVPPQVVPAAPVATGTQHLGEGSSSSEEQLVRSSDGQSEGRFFDKLCDIGLGFDCKKGYHKGKGKGGYSHHDISYVQPVQVVAVGGPVAAIPLGKGYHKGKGYHSAPVPIQYGPPAPTYHAPAPSYGPPPQPASGYGAPQPSYGAPPPTYHAPQSSYSVPAPATSSYGHHKGSNVVKHVHTHQHHYNGGGGFGGYAKDNRFSSSQVTTSFDSLDNSFSSKTGKSQFSAPSRRTGTYREDCECVPDVSFCSSVNDIIPRSSGNFLDIDARSKKTDILAEEDHVFSASESDKVAVTPEGKEEESSARHRRDTMVFRDRTRGNRDTMVFRDSSRATTASLSPASSTSRLGSSSSFNSLVGGLSYRPGQNGCALGDVCCRRPNFRQQREIRTCGRRNSLGLLGRVKNVEFKQGDTDFGEYPWQAAILRRDGGENVYVCGAALIDERHLLTAAHCITGMHPEELKIRLGEWDVGKDSEFYRHVERNVQGTYSHPDFYSGNLKNDIAVLRIQSPVDFISNPHISPVCLPDRFASYSGRRCHISGWGKDAFGSHGNFQHLLKEVDLPVVDHRVCQEALRQTRLGRQFSLHEGMVCAGGEEGKDACEGDGGSPLVCSRADGSEELLGLVSWGVGCGSRGVPGVYTNVPHYTSWIRSITRG